MGPELENGDIGNETEGNLKKLNDWVTPDNNHEGISDADTKGGLESNYELEHSGDTEEPNNRAYHSVKDSSITKPEPESIVLTPEGVMSENSARIHLQVSQDVHDGNADEETGSTKISPNLAETDHSNSIVSEKEMLVLKEAQQKEEALLLALEGNPAFVYEKIYIPGTKQEQQSYRCFKCPTAVDRMDRLEYHYQQHGANLRFRCTKCDFSHNFQNFLIRHEERHIQQRAAIKREPVTSSSVVTSAASSASINTMNNHSAEKIGTDTQRIPNDMTLDRDSRSNEKDDEIEISVPHLNKSSNDQEEQPSNGQAAPVVPPKVVPTKFHKSKKRKRFTFSRPHRKIKSSGNGKAEITASDSVGENGEEVGVATDTNTNTNSTIIKRKKFGAAQILSDEEYAKLRAGNPKLFYPDRYGTINGKRVAANTFKCYKCPSPYISFTDYVRHAGLHGAKLAYQCRVCDYSSPDRPHLIQHCELHRLQGNIPEDDLTIPPKDGKPSTDSAGEKPLPGNKKIPPLGSEEEFVIEYDMDDDDVLSDSEVLNFAPARKRLKTDNNGNAPSASPLRRSTRNKLTKPAVVVVEKLTPSAMTMSSAPQRPIQTSRDAEFYILKSKKESKFNPENYLLSNLKGNNFMLFTEANMVLSHDTIEFVSNQADGKSASIILALVAIGYDVLVEGHNPTGFCGWELRDLIKRGNDTAQLEILLSLKCFPDLQDKYGSHLRLERKLIRGLPLSSCNFHVSSADKSGQHFVPPKPIGMPALRAMLKEMNVLPQFYRIILLDRENMKYMTKHTESWYELFEEAKNCRLRSIKSKLTNLQLSVSRLDQDIQWRLIRLEFLKSQLEEDYPVQKSLFSTWRQKDIESLIIAEKELVDLEARRNELKSILSTYTAEIDDISATVLRQMNEMLSRFLHSQNCAGSIVVDEEKKVMGLWMRENYSATPNTEAPTAMEAQRAWLTLTIARKTTAVFGLYLSFWSIIESCPFFAVDSFSSSDLEFRFPKKGLPILLDLIKKKSGQQFFMSLPESDGAN